MSAPDRAIAKQRSALALLAAEITDLLTEMRREWQFWTVLALAVAVMAIMQANVPLWYFSGDHSDYYWYARYLLGDGAADPIPRNWRTPGMGMFHILSGTVILDTWKGFVALFALTSAAIPVLFFLIVRPHSRNFALIAGLVVIASMTSYIYATAAGSDQVYFFLHALFLFLCALYFHRRADRRWALPVGIAVVAAYANMVRPVGAILFWIFIFLALVLRRRDWRRLAASAALYMALMAAWIVWDRDYGTNGGLGPGLGFPLANELATTTERRLAQAYFSPRGLVHAQSAAAAAGYAGSERLRAVLRDFLASHPQAWQSATFFTPTSLFGRFAGDAGGSAQLLDALFADRNTLYFGFIVTAAKKSLGREAARSLLHGVAAEHGATGSEGLARFFLKNPLALMLGVTPNLGGRSLFATYFRAREYPDRLFSGRHIPQMRLEPDLGPANARLLEVLRQFIHDTIGYPQYWPGNISAQYRERPDALFRQVVRDDLPRMLLPQGLEPEQFIYNVLNWYLGPALAGELYGRAATEILRRYPALITVQLDNLLHLTGIRRYFGYALTLDRTALALHSDVYADPRIQFTGDLTRGLARGLVPVSPANEVFKTAAALHSFVYVISPLFLLLMIVALPFLRGSALLAPCLLLVLDYGYQLLSIAVFAPWGAPRYEASFYLLPLIVSCMIFGRLASQKERELRRECGAQGLVKQRSW